MSFWIKPPEQSDVVVIGGGLMGSCIAYHLSQRGIDCTVLEKSELAGCASGRNDGQIILETADYYPRMKEVYGAEEAFGIMDFKRRGQRGMDAFIQSLGDLPYLAYHREGSLTLAYNDVEAKTIEEASAEMCRDGFQVELVDVDQIEAKIGTRRFQMGKFDAGDASVNPAALTREIAREATRNGARFFEFHAVEKISDNGVVYRNHHGEEGFIEAEIVITATNAYTKTLLPEFENLVFPIRGQVWAGEPSNARFPSVACITNFGYEYWHWTPDGRMILGGKRYVDEHGETGMNEYVNPKVHEALDEFYKEMYPTIPMKVAQRWSGIMGFSKDGKPLIGPISGDPTRWCAVGFTGYGLGMCWSVGQAVAEVLNDEETVLTETLGIFSPSRFS